MSPSHVMFDPIVRLVPLPGGGGGGGKGKEVVRSEGKEAVGDPPSWLKKLRFVPDITDPPGISTLSLHLPSTLCGRDGLLPSARVESTDGNIVLMYAGPEYDVGKGYLLIYDSKKDSLSVIPQFDCLSMGCRTIVGNSTVIMLLNPSDYALVQLMSNSGGRPDGFSLLLRLSSSSTEWVEKLVHTPPKVLENFTVDTSFVFDDGDKRAVCWVDLLVGILMFNMSEVSRTEPKLRFIALPKDYHTFGPPCDYERGDPKIFRTIGCVRGVIKFISVDGYRNNGMKLCSKNAAVNTWTLKPILDEWERDERCSLSSRDLWEEKSFGRNMPHLVPLCPVLSMREDHIVYFFLNDNPPCRGSILRANMKEKKVEASSKYCLRTNELFPEFIVSTFSKYMDSSRCPQGNQFAKRIKL